MTVRSDYGRAIAPPLRARISGIMATGVASGAVAAIGDFFTPRGGWVALLVFGICALLAATYVFVTGGKGRLLRWIAARDRTLARWWVGSRFAQHGLHVVLVFGVVCLAAGFKSYDARAGGGLIARTAPPLAELQVLTGVADEVKATRIAVDHLTDVVKRETSDDPQKELANRGIPWSAGSVREAIANRDAKTVTLFLQGGFPIATNDALRAQVGLLFRRKDWETAQPLVEVFSSHGIDMLGAWARPEARNQVTPLGAALDTRSHDALDWLLKRGDRDALRHYTWIGDELMIGGHTCGDEELIAMVESLGEAGVPLEDSHAAYRRAYAAWFGRTRNLGVHGAEDEDRAMQIRRCDRVVSLLEPRESGLRGRLQESARDDARKSDLAAMEHELGCIDTALASELYEGMIIPRTTRPRPDEKVPYLCFSPVHGGEYGYSMIEAAALGRGRNTLLQRIEKLKTLR